MYTHTTTLLSEETIRMSARHGRFAFRTGWLGASADRRIAAGFIGDVPGSSVPIGRRLRT